MNTKNIILIAVFAFISVVAGATIDYYLNTNKSDKTVFTPEQTDWLIRHELYQKVMNSDVDKQIRIKKLIEEDLLIEKQLSKDLENLVDSMRILYPEAGIEFESKDYTYKDF